MTLFLMVKSRDEGELDFTFEEELNSAAAAATAAGEGLWLPGDDQPLSHCSIWDPSQPPSGGRPAV